jgi:glycerophosphoryl diester phosphodiesterase
MVIAHRGASGDLPENTFPAYMLALEQRADMIEIDLHLTRDAAIVISHDAELDHFGREGFIGDLSRAEVAELDAALGHGAGPLPVPELPAVLDRFGERIPFNLEIKRGERGEYGGLESIVLEQVTSRGLLERTLFSSFFDPVLETLRDLEPAARLATLVSPRAPEDVWERVARVGSEAVNPHFLLATPDFVAEAHDRGLAVFVYTVDEPELMSELLDRGVDGLFTNFPARMRALVESDDA